MWVGKRVLVTGAGGFIGSHLCEALVSAGAEVTAMIHYSSRSDWGNLEFLSPDHRQSLNVVSGDIQDSDFVMRQVKGQAVVFHLAALIGIPYSYVAPRSYLRTNIEGTLNVVEAAVPPILLVLLGMLHSDESKLDLKPDRPFLNRFTECIQNGDHHRTRNRTLKGVNK